MDRIVATKGQVSRSGSRMPRPITPPVAKRVWIGLGSNLGDRLATLERAVLWMDAVVGLEVAACSRWRETPPVGPAQPAYLNGAVRARTTLAPLELLSVLRSLEVAAGRVRRERWGPRTLDLDILLVEGVVLDGAQVTVPHPRLAERSFVLEPLCDLDPDLVHPVLDRSLSELLEALSR